MTDVAKVLTGASIGAVRTSKMSSSVKLHSGTSQKTSHLHLPHHSHHNHIIPYYHIWIWHLLVFIMTVFSLLGLYISLF
jgi:hypothetical protein